MKQEFKLTQLYKAKNPEYIMGTCMINDDRFECTIKGNELLKNQLWQFVQGNWKGLTCTVEFNDVTNEGLPIDGVIICVKNFTPVLT